MAPKKSGIRQFIARRALQKKESVFHRTKTVKNADSIHKAIILMDYNENYLQNIKPLSVWFGKHSIDYTILLYYPSKKYPDSLVAIEKVHFFTPADCNFWGAPNHPELERQMSSVYDMLIEFDENPSFPLEWISRLSQAPFKIGRRIAKPYLDLIISGKTTEDQEYTREIIHWLENLKTASK